MDTKNILQSEGCLCGWGLFETMQSYHGRVFALDAHLNRLYSSAKKIDLRIKQPRAKLKKAIFLALKNRGLLNYPHGYIRLNVWKKGKVSDFNVIVRKYSPADHKKGFKATVSSFTVNAKSILPSVKSLNYLLNILARNEAAKKGFDEAIILNTQGFVAEGSRSNIFFVKNGALFTPALDCGILPGITRKIVTDLAKSQGIKVKEGYFALKDLKSADEAFLTNSLIQIMPLTQIDRSAINKKQRGPVTQVLINSYQKLLLRRNREPIFSRADFPPA